MRTKVEKATCIINGIESPEDHTAATLEVALQMCESSGNTELYNALLPIYERKYEEFKEYHRQKAREHSHTHRTRINQRRRARYEEKYQGAGYTERQRGIIDGTIPYDDVHGNEYHGIRRIAISRGETNIVSFCEDMILEKQEDNRERNRKRAAENYRKGKNDPTSPYYRPPRTPKLNRWERSVLTGETDINECPEERLNAILAVCEANKDEHNKSLAQFLIAYRNDPLIVCGTNTKEATISSIKDMTWMPLPTLERA